MNKRWSGTPLERIADQAQIGGVCAGLADYFGVDRALVRVLFVIGIFLPHFPAVIIYIILWIALPERRFSTSVSQVSAFSNPYFAMNPYNPNKPASPDRSVIGGAVLIILGILFLIDRYFDVDFGDLWPFLLIALGLWLIFKDRIKQPYDSGNPYNSTNPYNSGTTSSGPSTPPYNPGTPDGPSVPYNPGTPTDPTAPYTPTNPQ